MTRTQAIDLIVSAIASLLTWAETPSVIQAEQSYSAPSSPHVRLTVTSEDRIGRPRRVSTSELRQNRVMDIQIDGIGAAAADQILRVHSLLFGDAAAVRALSDAGVAVQALTPVQNTSGPGQTAYTLRRTFTATFGYVVNWAEIDAGPAATVIVLSIAAADVDGSGTDEIDVVIDPLATIPV